MAAGRCPVSCPPGSCLRSYPVSSAYTPARCSGAIIPAMRAIFRRPKEDVEASNDTEYAFGKSKSLLRRIVDSVGGTGGLASFTFIVFAVLYVFSNEVSLRVAKAVGKRLKRLSAKVERQEELTEKDLEVFGGWRWRVLLWSS
ncbi:hypothetical protein GQ53DRAFT_753613 [Thozetella sp. PMI_491]|nr:hypothetical protein GQ53DRAFT_753613 [Thozetella sp. PMI_491]